MKKKFVLAISAIVILIAIAFIIKIKIIDDFIKYDIPSEDNISKLRVEDGKILNEKNEEVILKGISSHGFQWYSDLLTERNFKYLITRFKINTFRIAIYVNDNLDYKSIKNKLYETIDTLTNLNMYVIVDWHVLENGNPMIYKDKAKEVFEDISKKYSDSKNIIYEICNEPNGNPITWDDHIKPYSEEIIPIIRENSPNSLIVVGTPDYSKKVQKPADNPLDYENIVYAVHCYSGIDIQLVKNNILYAKEKNIAVLATEWGTTDGSGDGTIYEYNSEDWIKFLNENKIGYVNWSFSNKDESSAILKSKYNVKQNRKNLDKFLTDSGKLVEKIYNQKTEK